MSCTIIRHLYCDVALSGCAWWNDPYIGEPGETLASMLYQGRWRTVNGKHICPDCWKAMK